MKHLILAALFLVSAACRSVPDPSTAALLAADRAFSRDTQARRLDAWVAAFDAKGSQVDEEFGPITGHEAIRAHMSAFFADPANVLEWEPDAARVSEGGEIGTTTGRWKLSRRDAEGRFEVVAVGRYFDVWRKGPDAGWKLLYDVGDEDRLASR